MKKILETLLPISIGLTIVSLPLYVVRCKDFSWCSSPVPFTWLEVMIVLTTVIWLLYRFFVNNDLNFLKIIEKIPLFLRIVFLVFLLSALVATLISPNRLAAFGEFKAYFVEPFLFFIICFDYLTAKKDLRVIIWPLVITIGWISVLALVEKFFNFSLANQVEFTTRGRVSAVYNTSNALSLFLVPGLFVVLGYLFEITKDNPAGKRLGEIYLLTLGSFLAALGILVSGSRGGLVGVFLGVIVFLALRSIIINKNSNLLNTFKLGVRILVPVLAIFALIFLFNIQPFLDFNVKNKISPEFNSRLCLWQGGANLVKHNLVFGAGLASFQDSYKPYRTCSPEIANYPHTLLFNFWTELGLFGLISFLLLVTLVLDYLLAKKEKLDFLSVGLICAFAAILIHGAVDVPYFKNDLSALFWLLLALSLVQIGYQSFTVKHRVLLRPRR